MSKQLLGGAANASVSSRSGIERIMGLTIPVNTVSSRSGIDLFLSILIILSILGLHKACPERRSWA